MKKDYITFETERLVLRPFCEDDIEGYQKYFDDYEVVRYLTPVVPWPYPKDGARQYYNMIKDELGTDRWLWCLHIKGQEELGAIGAVHLWRKKEGKSENRGFWLGQKFWGKGYMTEATNIVTDYAFNELGFEKLVFSNAVGNKRSARVKEKAGATLLYREPCEFIDPQFAEHELWELKKEDWQKRRVA